MRDPWPLVGRDEEAAFLASTLDSDTVSGCVLSGVAGVGKTRLARVLTERARRDGFDSEWLVATPGTSRITLGALIPSLGKPPPPESAAELLHWATEVYRERDRLVLCVDDAHLLDHTSASLLLQLAARRHAKVVATIRTGETCPASITSLWKDAWTDRVELLPLGRHEILALIVDFLDAPVTPETADRLFDLSGGVPLYLRELLIAGQSEGSLTPDADGTLAWTGPVVPTARLTEVVGTRLARLPVEDRDALTLIALGEPLGTDVAEHLVGHPSLAELESHDVVTIEQNDHGAHHAAVRVAHPLYGEVLRESLGRTRHRELHTRLADAAIAVSGPEVDQWQDDELVRVATWLLESGAASHPDLLLTAGERALRTFDTELAEHLARAADTAGAGPRAQAVLADALFFANRWDDAAMVLDQFAHTSVDDETRARTAIRRSSLLMWADGDPDASNEHLTEMAGRITDPDLSSEVVAERIWPLTVNNRLDEATSLAERLVTDSDLSPQARMRALPPAVLAYSLAGQTDRALKLADESWELAAKLRGSMPTALGDLLAAGSLVLWLDGRMSDALGLMDAVAEEVAEDWSDEGRGLLGFLRAKAAIEMGHAVDVVELTDRAIDALEDNDIGLLLPWVHCIRARALSMLGNTPAVHRALADGERSRQGGVRLSEPDQLYAEALAADHDQPGTGAELSSRDSAEFERWGALPYALISLTDKVRYGGGDAADVTRAAALADACGGDLLRTLASLVDGLVRRDPGVLATVGDTCDDHRLDLHAAEAALVAAAGFDDLGHAGSALAERQKAEERLGRCGPVTTPIITAYGGDAPLARLTKRQRQVARLVASGLSNPEVAERLQVAPRTVDNHVQNIFTALGIHSREDLRGLS